jgi:hypothetical protein
MNHMLVFAWFLSDPGSMHANIYITKFHTSEKFEHVFCFIMIL